MAIRRQFRLTEDTDGNHTVSYVEYDDAGALIDSKEYPYQPKDEADSVRAWFEYAADNESGEEYAVNPDGSINYDINTTRDSVQKPALVPIATDERGRTYITDGAGNLVQTKAPIASGDRNVSDSARKREDGAAEPAMGLVDLNQPAQPIAGAPRGTAVAQSSTEPETVVDTNRPEDKGEAANYDPAHEEEATKDAKESNDDKSSDEGLEGGDASIKIKSNAGKGSESPDNISTGKS